MTFTLSQFFCIISGCIPFDLSEKLDEKHYDPNDPEKARLEYRLQRGHRVHIQVRSDRGRLLFETFPNYQQFHPYEKGIVIHIHKDEAFPNKGISIADGKLYSELRPQLITDLKFSTIRKAARYLYGFASQYRGEEPFRRDRIPEMKYIPLKPAVRFFPYYYAFKQTTLLPTVLKEKVASYVSFEPRKHCMRKYIIAKLVSHVLPFSVFEHTTLSRSSQRIIAGYL
jgi:hypothetical protein